MACVSGRSAAEARRLVGVGAVAYVGSHGAEVAPPGEKEPELLDAFASWQAKVAGFVAEREEDRELKRLRVRIEDKGPIKAFHWRGAPDEQAAETWLAGVAQEAPEAGLEVHWGRKVLEIRPPVRVSKGDGIRAPAGGRLAAHRAVRRRRRHRPGRLRRARVPGRGRRAGRRRQGRGASPTKARAAIVERADLAVDGVAGFTDVLAALAG